LQLDVAPTPDDRQVVLKPSIEMLSAPSENGPQRADAAAAWRALNLQPAENPEEKKRLMTLEAEAKTLKAQLAKRDEEFQARLDRLENSRFDGNVVYGLLGLLLAALAAAAYWWDRSRKTTASVADWSRHSASDLAESELHSGRISAVDVPLPVDEDEMVEPPSPPVRAQMAKPVLADALPEVVEHPPGFKDSVFDDLQALSAVTAPKNVFAAGAAAAGAAAMANGVLSASTSGLRQLPPGQPRSVVVDEFSDVRQHAEFFVSLGQYDQAIDLLKKTIDESIELNPLAYLELLKIHQKLGHEDEYERLRDDFNRVFNGRVPPIASFHDEGHRLQEHPSAMLKIENSWGTPSGLDTLEELLFRAPGNTGTPQFDLAAYRDLLMLYAVAKGDGSERLESPTALLAKSASGKPVQRPTSLPLEPVLPVIQAPGLAVALPALDLPVPNPTVGENSHTQPMLLLSEMAKIDDGSAQAKSAEGKNNEPLDLDLDLNLDFTNSELQAMADVDKTPDLDLDLPLLEDAPVTLQPPESSAGDVVGFPAAPPVDSNLIEFDLFDPSIEAKISPKNPK
jgi:tetratricopeptide (TPR) repeat protein